jgi:hypothetical protein
MNALKRLAIFARDRRLSIILGEPRHHIGSEREVSAELARVEALKRVDYLVVHTAQNSLLPPEQPSDDGA